jgi:two-component system CheB/CheR fusion protein
MGDKAYGHENADLRHRYFRNGHSQGAQQGSTARHELEGLSAHQAHTAIFCENRTGTYQVNQDGEEICACLRTITCLKDPPFSKIDLVSCRNVLIYLEPVLQKRALSTTFHYALNEGWLPDAGQIGKYRGAIPISLRPFSLGTEKIYLRKGPPVGRFMNVAVRQASRAVFQGD